MTTTRVRWLVSFLLLFVLAACRAPGGEEVAAGDDIAAQQSEAAVGGAATPSASASVDPDAIQVGYLAPTTGTVASSGQDMINGWNLYWEQNGTEVAGREVVTTVSDTAGDPAIGLSQAQRLVEQVDVDLVAGPLLANVGLAVADYLSRQGVPSFQHIASADNLTQRTPLEGVLRAAGWTSSQTNHAAGQWAYDEGYRRVVTICTDYAFGHESCGGFVNTFTDAGGEIASQLWYPLGTQDFGTYMAQIQSANPDAVYAVGVGADSIRFVEAYNDFGLLAELPLIGNETLTDQSLLRNMGPEAEGVITFGKFAEGRPEPGTSEFVDAYLEAYGELPSYYSANSYNAAMWTARTIEAVDGDVEDTEAFLEAAAAVEFEDSAVGPMRLDDYGNPVLNVYVREVQRRDDDRLWNVPVETFEDVSQFWDYDVEEFLDHPVYSRNYQGDGVWPEPTS